MTKFICNIILVCLFPYSVVASNEVGNGADNEMESKEAAWFLEPQWHIHRPQEPRFIRYCYVHDARFGSSPQIIEESLEQAFEIWTHYIVRKRINDFRDMQIVSRGKLQKNCDGNEDLKFHFGSTSPEIEEQKRKYANPTAFVSQESYDLKTGWGRGIVWLASSGSVRPEKGFPNWNQKGQLTAFLLHELGHIFGCSHIHGTIMDSELSVLIENQKYPKTHWSQIEYYREIIRENRDMTSYQGALGSPGTEDVENIFQLLFGRLPVGKVHSSLSYSRSGTVLLVSDDLGSQQFSLVLDGFDHDLNQGRQMAFRSFYWNSEAQENDREGYSVGAQIQSGHLLNVTGQKVQIALEIGTEPPISVLQTWPVRGPVNIKFQGMGRLKYLFTSVPL